MTERALVIGEALIDVVIRADGSSERLPGGSPMNVAIGLGRLGRRVALAAHIGQDADGESIVRHIAGSNVSLVEGSRSAHHTPTAQATLAGDGSASYVFDIDWQLDSVRLPPATHVHTGSIAAVLAPGAADVEAAIGERRGEASVSYDPNIRPQLMGTPMQTRPLVERLVTLADVVKASDEDLDWLYPGTDPLAVAREWLAHGPAIVVVTRGGEGVSCVARSGQIEAPARPADVVDTVGAGDSYMAGIIDALWREGLLGAAARPALNAIELPTLDKVLNWAAAIAAITVSRQGANPPRLSELPAY